MVIIRIGSGERTLRDADERWITQQVRRRRDDGQPVCVQVIIKSGIVDMTLSTVDCRRNGAGGRLPNRTEQRIFGLWDKQGLNNANFSGGNVVAFLKQLQQVL